MCVYRISCQRCPSSQRDVSEQLDGQTCTAVSEHHLGVAVYSGSVQYQVLPTHTHTHTTDYHTQSSFSGLLDPTESPNPASLSHTCSQSFCVFIKLCKHSELLTGAELRAHFKALLFPDDSDATDKERQWGILGDGGGGRWGEMWSGDSNINDEK